VDVVPPYLLQGGGESLFEGTSCSTRTYTKSLHIPKQMKA